MTNKTSLAMFAIAVFAVAGMGISPAFASSVSTTVSTPDVDHYDTDTATVYKSDVCKTGNTHKYSHLAKNWGSTDYITATWFTNHNSNCVGLTSVDMEFFVNGVSMGTYSSTSESGTYTFYTTIPNVNDNDVETVFTVNWT